MPSPELALAIFLATYVLISLRNVGPLKLDRPAVALLGAALMILFGIIGAQDVLRVFGPTGQLTAVLLLLFGMMLLVGGLEIVGFFDLVTAHLVKRARTPTQFLALLMVVVALLSALVLNDTIVLLFTPIIVKACRKLKLNPIPYLVGEAVAANVGSVATEVGNPQVALIAIASGIPFARYSLLMLPPTLACLGLAIGFMVWIYRKDLMAPAGESQPQESSSEPPPRTINRRALGFLGAVTSTVVAAFFLSSVFDWNLALIAFVGGAVATFALPAFRVTTAREVLMKVDWTILVFFIGLFIVLEGVVVSGLLDDIVQGFEVLSGGQIGQVSWLTAITGILSNLVSNVPAVVLLMKVLSGPSGTAPVPTLQWLVLAAASTLAGNATILGAAANVIVVQLAATQGVEVSFRDFTRAGMPITVATLLVFAVILQAYAVLGLL